MYVEYVIFVLDEQGPAWCKFCIPSAKAVLLSCFSFIYDS